MRVCLPLQAFISTRMHSSYSIAIGEKVCMHSSCRRSEKSSGPTVEVQPVERWKDPTIFVGGASIHRDSLQLEKY